MKFSVTFTESEQIFKPTIKEEGDSFNANFGEIQTVTKYVGETYEGDYNVTPKVEEQMLPTKDKVLTDDITVRSIPFFNVSNTSGGSTVYIGREV